MSPLEFQSCRRVSCRLEKKTAKSSFQPLNLAGLLLPCRPKLSISKLDTWRMHFPRVRLTDTATWARHGASCMPGVPSLSWRPGLQQNDERRQKDADTASMHIHIHTRTTFALRLDLDLGMAGVFMGDCDWRQRKSKCSSWFRVWQPCTHGS